MVQLEAKSKKTKFATGNIPDYRPTATNIKPIAGGLLCQKGKMIQAHFSNGLRETWSCDSQSEALDQFNKIPRVEPEKKKPEAKKSEVKKSETVKHINREKPEPQIKAAPDTVKDRRHTVEPDRRIEHGKMYTTILDENAADLLNRGLKPVYPIRTHADLDMMLDVTAYGPIEGQKIRKSIPDIDYITFEFKCTTKGDKDNYDLKRLVAAFVAAGKAAGVRTKDAHFEFTKINGVAVKIVNRKAVPVEAA